MRKKRILWICNHVTLMDAEVPLLAGLGFEVFVPKIVPRGVEFTSCVVKNDYDATLTIPAADLAYLNAVNFYDGRVDRRAMEIMDRNFDVAISTFYEKPLRMLIDGFHGLILIRAFGLAGHNNYYDCARENWGRDFLDRMLKIRDRVYFAGAYANMKAVEKNLFREHFLYLPLGLPADFGKTLQDRYTGTKRQILFVCPKICAIPYYWKIYRWFKRKFWCFPYVIAGNPLGKVIDRHLLGFLPREEFNRVFCESRVMFYHSVEPCHLHYHPLEAILTNQPVVFMQDGMLGQFYPKVKYPGACGGVWEARWKLLRILFGDWPLIRRIQRSQRDFLRFFSDEFVRGCWSRDFLPLAAATPLAETRPAPAARRERVGLILPIGYRGGTLHAFMAIANMLGACGYDVTAGIPEDYFKEGEYYYPEILETLKKRLNPAILIRRYRWRKVENAEHRLPYLRKFCGMRSARLAGRADYALMEDFGNDFCECDRWLFVSDRFVQGAPLPLRPYSVIVYDYLQRYTPFKMLDDALGATFRRAVAQADHVFVTNPVTGADMTNYCAVEEKNITVLPFEFSSRELENYCAEPSHTPPPREPYIVWACNLAWHKNHVNILRGLLEYYQRCNGVLHVYVTGIGTLGLDPGRELKPPKYLGSKAKKKAWLKAMLHIRDFRELFKKNRALLRGKVQFKGEMPRREFLDLLGGARFLLLSSRVDNGAFGMVESAFLNVPSASSDYPHIRYMAKAFGIDPLWYDGAEAGSIAEALTRMEHEAEVFRARLPERAALTACSYERFQSDIKQKLEEAWL